MEEQLAETSFALIDCKKLKLSFISRKWESSAIVDSLACSPSLSLTHIPSYDRKNIILSDCICHQEINAAHYTPVVSSTDPPVTAMSSRWLQQAMLPGQHLVSIHCAPKDYAAALEKARAGKIIMGPWKEEQEEE